MIGLLWTLFVIFLIAWIVLFLIVHVTGGFIHILLAIAVILLIWNLIAGSRARV